MLNPLGNSQCLDTTGGTALLPILVNQTSPTSIILARMDLLTRLNETLEISGKECRRMKKQADKELGRLNSSSPRTLSYPVRQTGLYRLVKVIDQSGLEVQRQRSEMLVVACPTASIQATSVHRCRGELSDFRIHVDGIPPLKVNYSKTINGERQSHVQLNVHPDRPTKYTTDLWAPGMDRGEVVQDIGLLPVQAALLQIPLNETLSEAGLWTYSIDAIRDGSGNTVLYTGSEGSEPRRHTKGVAQTQRVHVHERPSAMLHDCSSQTPLKVAAGRSTRLPIWVSLASQSDAGNPPHSITYRYSPLVEQDSSVDQEVAQVTRKVTVDPGKPGPLVREPGRYSIVSVATEFCTGEVLEPSSCLLLNPPRPDLSITHEDIPHMCAGNSIGLSVSLDFIGTPGFKVSYNIKRDGGSTVSKVQEYDSMRAHMELRPPEAGLYTYEFLEITDAVYKVPRPLKHVPTLQKAVKPTASASFSSSSPQKEACIGEPATFEIDLAGDSPWILEYDLVHEGKREKYTVENVTQNRHTLETPCLHKGGLYTLALAAVTDDSGCRITLQQEAQILVRHERPMASFGVVEGRRQVSTLQGRNVNIPIRLSGRPPWSVMYRMHRTPTGQILEKRFHNPNDVLGVTAEGSYELLGLKDASCPGSVHDHTFEVRWIARPTMHVSESDAISKSGNLMVKTPVCEEDPDRIDMAFSGSPPYVFSYDIELKQERGPASARPTRREEKVASSQASIKLETSRAGVYTYVFRQLGDQLYDHDADAFVPIAIQQTVHPRPTARFEEAGKTFSFCKNSSGEKQGIPMVLTGSPPFLLEIAVRHHASSRPEVINVANIVSNRFNLQIPDHALSLGVSTVTIRSVRDHSTCQRTLGKDSSLVRVNIADVPSIAPLEQKTDFCVGERIAFSLIGTPPFSIFYTFEGVERHAKASGTIFSRVAERQGNFTITALSDRGSPENCRAQTSVTKTIHGLPSVRVSRGRTTHVDIHEGGKAQIDLDFGGTPPFEYT